MAVGEGRTETTVYFCIRFFETGNILFGDTWLKFDNCCHIRRIRTEGRGMRLVRTCADLGVSVGLAITIVLLSIGTALKVEGIHDSGFYGKDTKNPRMSLYCIQLWVWVAIVSVQRLTLWGMMHIFRNPLGTFGNWMFGPIKKDADGMAAIVLIVIPILTSIIEYWIQDDILMGVAGVGAKSPVKYKPLKKADDDDDIEKSLNMRGN